MEANAVINCVDRPTRKAPSTAPELADVNRFQTELPPWGGSWGDRHLRGHAQAGEG